MDNKLKCLYTDVLLEWRHLDVLWGVMPLPTFHTFAFMMQLYAPLVNGLPVGLYAPRAPAPPPVPSPKNVIDACRALKCNAIAIVPAFIEVSSSFMDCSRSTHFRSGMGEVGRRCSISRFFTPPCTCTPL